MPSKEAIKNKVLSYIQQLETGGAITLQEVEDKTGAAVASLSLRFSDTDGFVLSRLWCSKAKSLKLGDCDCTDHPTYKDEQPDGQLVYSHLRALARQELEPDKLKAKMDKAAKDMRDLKKMAAEVTVGQNWAVKPKAQPL